MKELATCFPIKETNQQQFELFQQNQSYPTFLFELGDIFLQDISLLLFIYYIHYEDEELEIRQQQKTVKSINTYQRINSLTFILSALSSLRDQRFLYLFILNQPHHIDETLDLLVRSCTRESSDKVVNLLSFLSQQSQYVSCISRKFCMDYIKLPSFCIKVSLSRDEEDFLSFINSIEEDPTNFIWKWLQENKTSPNLHSQILSYILRLFNKVYLY